MNKVGRKNIVEKSREEKRSVEKYGGKEGCKVRRAKEVISVREAENKDEKRRKRER